jgi:copper transport protein
VTAVATLTPLAQLLVFLDDTGDRGFIGSIPRLVDSFDTTAGSMLLLRTVTAAILLVLLSWPPDGRGDVLASNAVLGLIAIHLVTLAYGGHSRSMSWPLLGVPVDVIHTAASMAWLGGLVVVTFLVVSTADSAAGMALYASFGKIAQRAVILIIVTGVIQTLRLHGGIVTLFTQSHGRWLLLKIALVVFMLWVGDINRRRIAREITADESVLLARFTVLRRAGITEAVSGGLVIAVTAALVSSSFD